MDKPDQRDGMAPQLDLEDKATNDPEKLDEQLEAESIASALGLESSHEPELPNDLEKATTQASHHSHDPATRVRTAVDWETPFDPENPQQWPLWKKAYHTVATGALAFAVTAGSSLITPSTDEIAAHFAVSRTASILSLTLFVLGLAMGPVIAAPISETFGRAVVYKVTPILYMAFIIGAGFSKSFGSLLVCRLLAGIVGSPVLAVGAGTSADIYPQHNRAIASSVFVMMPFLGPALGPVIGGFAAQFKGWRWTQWCTVFIAVVAYAVVLPMSETYKKVILAKRAKKFNIEGPPKPNLTRLGYIKLLLTITLVRPVHMLLTEPMVFFLSLYNSFTFAVLFAFFAAYPYTFTTVYGFNVWQNGLAFLGILVGVLSAIVITIVIDRKVYTPKYKRVLAEGKTAVAPEHRLYAAMIGAVAVPVGLFWFAWTARPSVHWIVPILAGIPFAMGNLLIFIAAALYLIDVYGPLGGASAMAANGLARYSMGAVFPLFTIQMYEYLGIGWATSTFGFISMAMMVIPFIFFKFGPRLRAKSSYDTLKA